MGFQTRHIPLIALACMMLSLSGGVYALLRKLDHDRIRAHFNNDALEHINLIEARLESDLLAVESLAAFHGNSNNPTQQGFRRFAAALRSRCPAIQAWEWVPWVPADLRSQAEAQARREGFDGYTIRERTAEGHMHAAPLRDEYFPVLFVEPVQGNEAAVGYDLGSEPVRRRAFEAARDTGRTTATSRITLVQETQGQAGVLVFVPVYRDRAIPDTVAGRRASLLGFALAVVRIHTLVQTALEPLTIQDLSVRLDDATHEAHESLYTYHHEWHELGHGRAAAEEPAAFRREHVIDLAGRKWLVVCEAPESYVSARRSGQPEYILAIGLITASMVCVMLAGSHGRAQRVERLVRHRTQELSRANEKLAIEVAERQKAESVLLQQQRDTRTLLDALPGYAFFKDVDGTYRMANEAFRRAVGCYPEPIAGRSDRDLFPESLAAKYQEDDRRVFENGRPLLVDEESFVEQGRLITVATRKVPLLDDGGRVLGLIGLGFDITQRKLAEQALKEERDLFVAGPVVVLKRGIAAGWPIEYVSANVLGQLGYNPAELASCAQSYAGLIHSDDLAHVREDLAEHLRRGDSFFEQQYRIRRKNGDYRWVYDFTAVVTDRAGLPVGLRGYLLDIEDRRQLEESHRRSREQLELVLEGNQDGLWDWNILTGEIQYSERWATMLGYDLDEVAPHVGFWDRLIHPDDKPAVMEAMQNHLQGLVPQYEAEYRLETKSGGWIWILDRGKVVRRGPDGRPERAAGTHTDITLRRQAQHELMTLRQAVEQSIDGLLVADVDSTIRYVNRSFAVLHGYSIEDLVGKPLSVLKCTSTDHASTIVGVEEAWAGEDVHCRKGGQRISVWVTRNVMKDELSRPVGIIMTVRDITSAKQAEAAAQQNTAAVAESLRRERAAILQLEAAMEQLRAATNQATAADRTKSDFLANMSHEIRSPLTAIIGYIDMLSSDTLDPPERQDCHKQVRRSAHHLLGLINDVLDLSKIEAGQMRLRLQWCSLPRMIEEVCSLFRPQAESKSIHLAVSWSAAVPETIETDAVRFKQVLTNLVGNAVKFTSTGGVNISVAAQPAPDFSKLILSVSVLDTGIGIDADRIAQIFSPFVQVHDRSVRDYGGTGLGLAISRNLARQLGGDILLRSTVGRGSTFTLSLPVAVLVRQTAEPEPSSTRTSGSTPSTENLSLEGVRVLVVDDTPENQRIIRFMLERMNAEVETVENGQEAVDAVLRLRQAGAAYDLILMDMRMPVMDGYSATTTLRQAGVTTPIVALTAYAMVEDESRCLSAGCDAYLSKPIDPTVFKAVLMRQTKRGTSGSETASGVQAEETLPLQAPPVSAGCENPPRGPTGTIVSHRANEPRFLPILQKYLESLPPIIQQLEQAQGHPATDALRTSLHRLAGTGTMYGLPRVSEAARECERALTGHADTSTLDAALARLADILRWVEIPATDASDKMTSYTGAIS